MAAVFALRVLALLQAAGCEANIFYTTAKYRF